MPAEDARRILIVDDEEELAWSLASRLGRGRPQWSIETAYEGATALSILRSAPVDLLVADVRMPGMNGIDLVLATWQLDKSLPVILMTAFKTADLDRLPKNASVQFLEKPFDFELLLSAVERGLESRATVGFSGAISVQTLPDIVQLYVLSSATGLLTVRRRTAEGNVYFHQGAILHAVTPSAKGEEAFHEIMTWSGGEFSMRLGVVAPERTVTANWQELLMESCRRIDENRRNERASRGSGAGWTLVPPPAPDADPFSDFEMFEPSKNEPLALSTNDKDPKENSMNIKDSLAKLNSIDGFVGAALVDGESGMLLGQEGGGSLNLEVAAAGNTEVVKAKRKAISNLQLKDSIEDILISLGKQYHLIRPLRTRTTLFFYVALDRQRANLAMARIALADVEKDLQV